MDRCCGVHGCTGAAKLLRPYFKYERKLFADVSKLIHSIISDYYREFTEKMIITGSIVSHRPMET